MKFIHSLIKFWSEHPALFHGIAFLLGINGALNHPFFILLPALCLWLPFLITIAVEDHFENFKPLILNCLVLFTAWFYGISSYQFPDVPAEGLEGTAYIHIQSLVLHKSYFGENWSYQCQLYAFFPTQAPNRSIARHIKCFIVLPQKKGLKRPLADKDYLVKGTFMRTSGGHYMLKVQKTDPWRPVQGSWNLVEKRYQAKKWMKNFIHKHIKHRTSAIFLAGLATGEFEDRMMQEDFTRFGLQHIMAISGFHFAIIAGLLSFFLRFIMPRKLGAIGVIFLLSTYFVFLGCSPSILRSWVMISLVMIGYLIEKTSKALNTLGVALLVVLGIDPLLSQTLGFQFSFLATAAILLLHAPLDHYLTHLIPKRPLSQMVEMDGWNQHGYYLLFLFRQGIALAWAVNLFSLPLTLYYFHKFPWMSLLYNLFFPLLVSFSLFLLLSGLLAHLIWSPLGVFIHAFNSIYTKWILSLTAHIPPSLDRYYEVETFPTWLILFYLCLASLFSIWVHECFEQQKEIWQDFAFI